MLMNAFHLWFGFLPFFLLLLVLGLSVSLHGWLTLDESRVCWQDMSKQPPTQELAAKDLHGNEWRFKHIFRGNYSLTVRCPPSLLGSIFVVIFCCVFIDCD